MNFPGLFFFRRRFLTGTEWVFGERMTIAP
jgi:hypothetical protein